MRKTIVSALIIATIMLSYQAFAESGGDILNSDAEKAANEGYKYQQQQQKMKEYQNQSGNYNPGVVTRQVAPNNYAAPTYNNGAAGGQVARIFK